ncbi:MAG TPA: carbohydrate ABC transporter permease [Acetobacteraceae bacterium]|jgi:multiple sugar transport system permease protein
MIRRRPSLHLLRGVVLLLVLVWSGVPIAFVVLSSFKPNQQIFTYPPTLLFAPTLEHYRDLLAKWPDFLRTLGNSLAVTVGATLVCVGASLLAGYVYSRVRSRIATASAFYMVGIRLLPPIVVTLPLFPLADRLGLSDTRTVLIILYASFFVSLCTLLLKSFIDTIPEEIDQAARIDGASDLVILLRIVLPLSVQGLVAAGVFVVVYSWNEYLFAFIFTTTRAKTAPLLLSEMMSSLTGVDWGVLFAAVTVQLVPIAVFVMLVQRFLISGLTAGALKG